MANEIKYLSYEGLDYFWKQKLRPIIEENEEVVTTSLVDFDNRLNTHTHTYVASAGYSASAARATYAASAGYAATAARSVTSANSVYSASAGYSASAARATYSASAGYVYRVNLLGSNSSVYYPMVFTSARTATVGALLYVDSGVTDTTSTATGIRYNPSLNRCYCSGGFYEASDDRLKNFGDDIEVNLNKLSQLSKKYFTWKDDKSNVQQIGVSAQEIQKLYPEIVNIVDEDGHLSVSYDKLSVIALKGIDILNNELKSLKERITKLEKLINIK